MSIKARPPTHLWVLDVETDMVHAAKVVGEGGLWDDEAACGEELDISRPASPPAPEVCKDCAQKLRRRGKRAFYRN